MKRPEITGPHTEGAVRPDAGPSRRSLLAAAALLGAPPRASAGDETDRPVEARMRLAGVSDGAPRVALTLDACPGAFDDRIVSALIEEAIAATIFVTGVWIRRNPAGLRRLLDHPDLFALENHGLRHVPPVLGGRRVFGLAGAPDLAAVRAEVRGGATAIEAVGGGRPAWYRGATGFYSAAALAAIRDMGLAIAAYSVNADMGASLPARAVAARIAAAADGSVIVAHVNQPRRPSGLGVVAGVRALRRRGVRFVRLDRLTASDVRYG